MLRAGDRVRVVSPASRPSEDLMARGVEILESWGLVVELAPHVDLAAVRRNPKALVGFSDITSLQALLWESTRLATLHGPMVNWNDERTGPESAEALRSALMTTDPIVLKRDPDETTAPVTFPGWCVRDSRRPDRS
ncbi:MAG: hypothetical protein GEV11_24045 [Streptosporangiales bacterium]|nr:hypothetical protein [Streptosporangiales bacterium]